MPYFFGLAMCIIRRMTNPTTKTFKGFGDWVEIFSAGKHTDSDGVTATFSEKDLDDIVSNHSTEHPAPLVIGHPKTHDPAFGWTGGGLRRVGKKLQAKFSQLVPEFVSAVKKGQYRNRSISIARNKDGKYFLQHVGFLGAMLPAVSGLKPMSFSEIENAMTFEYSDASADFSDFADPGTPNLLGRFMRRLREHFIDKENVDVADRIVPEHMIDRTNWLSERAHQENRRDAEKSREAARTAAATSTPFNQLDQGQTMSDQNSGGEATFSQSQLDAAVAAAVTTATTNFSEQLKTGQAELATERAKIQLAENQAFVSKLVDDKKLLPAMAVGLSQFMATLSSDEASQFEFSVGEGDKPEIKKVSQLEFVKNFLTSTPAAFSNLTTELGNQDANDGTAASNYAGPDGYVVDPERDALHRKAVQYQSNHEGCSYVDAVKHVEQQ